MVNARLALLASLTTLTACSVTDDPQDSLGDALTVSGTPVFCRPMTAASGALSSDQRADALDRAELTGTKDDWRRYVELSTGTQLVCRYTVPAGASGAALTLTVNYRGPTRAEMKVPFEAYDPVSKSWVTVGDNAFARDWRWTRSAMNLPAGLVGADGAVQLRVTTGAADVADLDELVVWVQGADAGTVSPPPAVDAGSTMPPPP
ncbi:MAG: hypothetical protein K1X89_14555, partial [Myxococcaceae bacterium]|nr:hypothetical protein [Myxococcaceae bacterium]